jgi:hypothetical protein
MFKVQSRFEQNGLSRATLLWRALRSAVEGVEKSGGMRYGRLSQIAGAPRSTLCRWTHGESDPSLEAAFCLLERLPLSLQTQIITQYCRDYPTLENSRISHDEAAKSQLLTRLAKPCGITIVRGADTPVTFLLTAIAQSLPLPPATRHIVGIDIHEPTWFVPASGITYLNNNSSDDFDRTFRSLFNSLTRQRAKIVIINAESHLDQHRTRIMAAAQHHHLVIARSGEAAWLVSPPIRPVPIVVTEEHSSERIHLRFER